MHTLILKINNDDSWQQLLSFVKKLPATEVTVQESSSQPLQASPWDAMRQALPELAKLDMTGQQPPLQTRELF